MALTTKKRLMQLMEAILVLRAKIAPFQAQIDALERDIDALLAGGDGVAVEGADGNVVDKVRDFLISNNEREFTAAEVAIEANLQAHTTSVRSALGRLASKSDGAIVRAGRGRFKARPVAPSLVAALRGEDHQPPADPRGGLAAALGLPPDDDDKPPF